MVNSIRGLSLVAIVLAIFFIFLALWMPADVVNQPRCAVKQVWGELVQTKFNVSWGSTLNKSSLVHILLFGVLAGTIYLNLHLFQTLSYRWVIGLSLLAPTLLGVLTELGQILVKGRSYSNGDIILDLLGAGIGTSVAYFLSRYWAH